MRTLSILLALAALMATGVQAADPPRREIAFVANAEAGTVTLVDVAGRKVLGAIDINPGKRRIDRPGTPNFAQDTDVSPDGRTLYVSRGYLGDVAAFDIASGKLLWRLEAAGVRADHIALSPDGSRLFVSAITANEVQMIDTRTHSFVGSFASGDWPHVLEFSPDERYIFNGSLGNQLLPQGADGRKQLTIADPNTLQVVRTYQFDAGVRPFAIDPDG